MEKPCAQCGKVFAKPSTLSRAMWPKRLYCSRACQYAAMRGRPNPKLAYWKGKRQSPETLAKLSEYMKREHAEGRRHVIDNTGLRGEQTSRWKGDDIVYRSAHSRLTRRRGNPAECELCGATGRWIEWALKNDAAVVKVEVAGVNAGKRFSPRPDDYIAACRPCHRAYDRPAA